MLDRIWLSAVCLFIVESLLESALIFLIVWLVARQRTWGSPAALSRLLLLPLIIPVLFSPALHLLFPQLARLALIVQIESNFPVLANMREGSASLAPALLVVFFTLFALNVAQWVAIGLREVLDGSRAIRPSVPQDFAARLARLALDFGVTSPRLVISKRHPLSAYVFGWRNPIITLGREWLTRLDAQERDALLAHELAHFSRGDNWLMLVAKVCRDMMFFNPFAHYVYSRLVAAREEAADDFALCVTRKPLALASCLLKFWQARQPAYAFSGGLSLVSQPSGLERRIRRLMSGSYHFQSDQQWDYFFYGLCLCLAIVFSVV